MIKKHIESKEISKYVCVPKKFREDYFGLTFNKELLNESKLVIDVIYQIMSDLSNYMYQPRKEEDGLSYIGPENQQRLELWQNDFLGKDKSITITYNISQFLKNRDKRKMKDVLILLKLYQAKEYSFQNYRGETITTYGGLIKDFLFAEKSGNFEIEISQYWATRIVEKVGYNRLYKNVKKFKSIKQIFFVMWLIEFGLHQTKQGLQKTTTISYTELQERYDLKYKNCYDFIRNWIVPMKTKLDSFDEGYSFQYSIDDKNKDNIVFVQYEIKPKNNIIPGKASDDQTEKVNINSISYKSTYLKRRHNLSAANTKAIKEIVKRNYYLFEKNYQNFLKDCTSNKKKATDFLDDEFILKFKEFDFEIIN